ncbi:hypothetical protein V8G54_002032 [Vigna mungo]|uniref:Uncharacterized protein n=1 Tax=Vigna mungo TaxID=3915 RepID=A0AAQ3P8I4_VIGMU
MTNPVGVPSGKDSLAFQSSGLPSTPQEADGLPPTATEKQDSVEPGLQDAKSFSEKKDNSHAKPSSSETDTKLEQEVLEREIGRLRALYQQQQQPQTQPQQQPSGSHRRSNSRDLESQFANLSLKHKDTNSGQDPALRI